MASNEQVYITTVKLNTEEAKNKLNELLDKEKQIHEEYNKALQSGDSAAIAKTEKALRKTRAEVKQLRMETMNVDDILKNLSSQSIDNLNKAAKALSRQMNKLGTDTKEFADKADQLKKVRQRLEEARKEGKAQESWINRANDAMNRWQTTLMSAVAAITGITMTIRKATQDYADMEEAMADVQKYTGQTTEEVHEMNEEFKKMDTRTSREKLNQLAGDAGRLGITGKEQIMEFVDAADKINVALGDDLGDEAVKNIGKLADAFGDSDTMGLRGAMLATGSALNELAQSSSADAGYISSFEARFAGLGNQAHMTQTQIMGLASVLDQNMQQEETSSTALAQLMTKMFTEPDKFARLAGQNVKEFTDLLKNDANEALLTFLSAMRDKGGFDSLAPMFEEMGLSGTRCVGVLSTLATNLDNVRQQQKIAADAFSEGTSVLKEYNVQNNTVQAGIDKAKKKFLDLSADLGEKLLPVVKYTISASSLLVKALSEIIKFCEEYGKIILSLTATVTAYLVVANAQYLLDQKDIAIKKLKTIWNDKVIAGTKALWAVLRANPYAAIIAALTAVVALYASWATTMKNNVKQQKLLNAVEEDAISGYADEVHNIEALNAIIHDNSRAIGDRKWAIQEMQKIIPEYHASLNTEGQLLEQNANLIDAYCKKLKLAAQIQAASAKLTDAEQKQKAFGDNTPKNLQDALFEERVNGRSEGEAAAAANASLAAYRAWKAQMREVDNEVDTLTQYIESKTHEMASIASKATNITNKSNGGGGGGSTNNGKTKSSDPYKAAIDKSKEIAKQQNAINEMEYATGLKLKADYEQRKYEITMEEQQRELAIYKKGSEEYNTILAEYQKTNAEQMHAVTELQEEDIEEECKNIEDALRRAFNDPSSDIYQNQEALDQALFENTYKSLEKRRNLYAVSSQEYVDLNKQMQEADQANSQRIAENFTKKTEQFKTQYLKLSDEERKTIDLNFAKELHEKGLLNEEEYQKALKAIEDKYQKKDTSADNLRQYGAGLDEMGSNVVNLGNSIASLTENIKDGTASWMDYAAVGEAAIMTVMSALSNLSSYYSACCDLEVAESEKKYDAEIKAAGNNTKKTEKLEEEKEKASAAIKSKYNEKAMALEEAQAVASTAMAAINAYASAAQVPYIGYIIAPIAAAAALAAGAIQIATIKKQHEAEAAGYYEGGYTGGSNYRREAGVVHEGEFVANHNAVNNPAISPVLSLIDYAQRRNTVGSLKESDIVNAVGGGAQVIAPVVNVSTDNTELEDAISGMNAAVDNLVQKLNSGIEAYSVISGPNGTAKQLERYNRLMNNK